MQPTPALKKQIIQAKLQKAIELEWATIPPYLMAYYSLKPEANREVAALIKSVFMEEMLHMVLAANVLSATGGNPTLHGSNCPEYPLRLEFQGRQFADRKFDIHLAKLSPESLNTFLQIELPRELFSQPAVMTEALVVPGSTIGEFYDDLMKGLRDLVAEAGESFVFNGVKGRQIPPDFYWSAGGGIVEVNDLETALKALTIIVDQGEGTHGAIGGGPGYFKDPNSVAHYFRFNEILQKRLYLDTDRPDQPPSGPPLAVDYQAVFPIKTDCAAEDFAADPTLVLLNDNFNRQYTAMVKQLNEALNGNPGILYSATLGGMRSLRDIASSMMQIPLPNHPGLNAAPTFRWHHEFVEERLPRVFAVAGEASRGMAALRSNAGRDYYDSKQDEKDRSAYYATVNWNASPEDLYRQLSTLLRTTHARQPAYKPSLELYPWVDLQPDLTIRSVYSGASSSPEAFIQHDERMDESRQSQLNAYLAAAGTDFAALSERVAQLEVEMPYNCEHSVPQSWFKKNNPMKGDLHHLFSCEVQCNSTRGNQPYFEYPANPEAGNDCGLRGGDGFEPKAGKGAVARSTLYFLLRYPLLIGDRAGELSVGRLPILLRWHYDSPPGDWEKHRNQAIFERQGNRNPLIDYPEFADRINFEKAFGEAAHHLTAAVPPATDPLVLFTVSRHQEIAEKASTLLAAGVAERIAAITISLGAQVELRDLAGWADQIKGQMPAPNRDQDTNDFLTKFPNDASKVWHYVNLPLGATSYQAAKDAGFTRDNDVVQMLRTSIAVLRGQSQFISKLNALRWLVHLTGDVHQPVHVGCCFIDPGPPLALATDPASIKNGGFATDHGGNDILLPMGPNADLHGFWDGGLSASIVDDSPAPEIPNVPIDEWPALWANESLTQARAAYQSLKIVSKASATKYKVSWEGKSAYMARCSPILSRRMTDAAYRLAHVLNAVFHE